MIENILTPLTKSHEVKGFSGTESSNFGADIAEQRNIELLIADDEPEIINEMSEYLERKGFICHKAGDGKQALSLLKAHCDIGVVITDIKMPEMDGLETIQIIRDGQDKERDVKTIIITGTSGRKEAILALQNGASDFISKPVSLKILAHAIGRCIKEIKAQQAVNKHAKLIHFGG